MILSKIEEAVKLSCKVKTYKAMHTAMRHAGSYPISRAGL
jgi:hypothetical protein